MKGALTFLCYHVVFTTDSHLYDTIIGLSVQSCQIQNSVVSRYDSLSVYGNRLSVPFERRRSASVHHCTLLIRSFHV